MGHPNINILIVEDEAIVALDLATALEKDGYTVTGIADNGPEALALFKSNPADIALMDINLLGEMDGIATTHELLKIKQVPVIFLTAFTDDATIQRVKETQPAAFLSKPYQISNVRISIELALSNFAIAREKSKGDARVISMRGQDLQQGAPEKDTILQLNDAIFVKNQYRFEKVLLADILYMEADNMYVNLFAREKKFVLRISLNQLLEKIHFAGLARVHRSYAVNMDAVSSFGESEVMVGKTELPIGRSYKEDFLRQFRFR